MIWPPAWSWSAFRGGFPSPTCPFLALAFLLSGNVFTVAGVIFHSAAFWLGPVDSLARTMSEFLITFSVYPETIFGGPIRLVSFTLLPAACTALVIFDRGLCRYESGNQIGAR